METLVGEIQRALVLEQHSFSWSQVQPQSAPTTLRTNQPSVRLKHAGVLVRSAR